MWQPFLNELKGVMRSEYTNRFVHCSDWFHNYSRRRNSWRTPSNLNNTLCRCYYNLVSIEWNLMIEQAKVLKAISETMTCEKCPYPCNAKEHSSQANCVMHWSKILSQINPDADWKEIRYKVYEMF